jgi:hypothetical protein
MEGYVMKFVVVSPLRFQIDKRERAQIYSASKSLTFNVSVAELLQCKSSVLGYQAPVQRAWSVFLFVAAQS